MGFHRAVVGGGGWWVVGYTYHLPPTTHHLSAVQRIDFRGRLFAILLLFALVPSIVLSLAWAATSWWGPRSISTAAWDSTAVSGARAPGRAGAAAIGGGFGCADEA